jgi:molecular chaperone GrpE
MPERDNKTQNEAASTEEVFAAEEDAERAAAAELEAEVEVEAETPEITTADFEIEIASLKDQLLRALAETENLRRRGQREREDALKYAAVPFMRDLIGVVDNLRRAMASVSPEAQEADEHLKTLMAGLEMTEKELATVFERHHIVKIDPLGERLDPHSHEAMFEVPDPETPSGTVVQVVQAGYRLHDRLLRPAQVGVAKGGPASQPNAAPAPQPQAPAPAQAPAGGEPEAARRQPAQKPTPKTAGNDDEPPPGSTIDTSA